jgi:hypothetical protein
MNHVLARSKALEAKRQAYLDAVIKASWVVRTGSVPPGCSDLPHCVVLQRREDEALLRLEHQELLREAELKARSEVREHRIRSATEVAKAVEERRQRRARRRIIKKFLKSAALQMTSLEDVEKEAELKVLREQKRKDYVARAELKQEFRVQQIQERIREKEERVKAQEEAKKISERRAKLAAQRELLTRQKILSVDVSALRKAEQGKSVLAELAAYASHKAKPVKVGRCFCGTVRVPPHGELSCCVRVVVGGASP